MSVKVEQVIAVVIIAALAALAYIYRPPAELVKIRAEYETLRGSERWNVAMPQQFSFCDAWGRYDLYRDLQTRHVHGEFGTTSALYRDITADVDEAGRLAANASYVTMRRSEDLVCDAEEINSTLLAWDRSRELITKYGSGTDDGDLAVRHVLHEAEAQAIAFQAHLEKLGVMR